MHRKWIVFNIIVIRVFKLVVSQKYLYSLEFGNPIDNQEVTNKQSHDNTEIIQNTLLLLSLEDFFGPFIIFFIIKHN